METTDVPGRPPDQDPIPLAFWARVLAYAKTLAQVADAEDLTQEAHLETLQKPADPSLSLEKRKALVFGIVKNKHRHLRRHATVELNNEDEIGREMVHNQSQVGDPELDAERRQLRGLEFTAINELNPYYQQLIYMRFFDEMMPAEIAVVLGLRVGKVKKALSRALKQLREDDGLRNHLDEMES
jgi:RNA polymerase sigma factor (sigma-70 family)